MKYLVRNKKTVVFVTLSLLALALTLRLFGFVGQPELLLKMQSWTSDNLLVFFIILVAYKTISVLWPPLPSGMITLATVPIIGWFTAYLADFLGSLLGGTVTYTLGNKFGLKIISLVFEPNLVNKISKLKVNPRKEIEGVFVLRTLLGTTVLEAVGYCSGMFKIKYSNFLLGWGLSHLVVGLPSYFLLSLSLNTFGTNQKGLILGLLPFIVFLLVINKLKKRYFLEADAT